MGHDLIHMVLLHREPKTSLAPPDVTGMSFDRVPDSTVASRTFPHLKLCRLEPVSPKRPSLSGDEPAFLVRQKVAKILRPSGS